MQMGSLSAQASDVSSSKDIALLKKSHDMAEDQQAQLINSLPQPKASPPGMGMGIDVSA
ncbi:MAG: YjfB family protein [Fibrobacterales bacterium]